MAKRWVAKRDVWPRAGRPFLSCDEESLFKELRSPLGQCGFGCEEIELARARNADFTTKVRYIMTRAKRGHFVT